MIRFENVTLRPFIDLDFEVKSGRLCKILTESDFEKSLIIQGIIGGIQPESGRVFLFGQDLWSVGEGEIFTLFRKIGMVLDDGGIISNLKVGENIILPTWYHKSQKLSDAWGRVRDIYTELGFEASRLSEYLWESPGSLPAYEKRIMALVRAMLMEPELMIYDALLEGMDHETARRVLRITEKFHSAKRERTSVFISSDEQSIKDVRADKTVWLLKGGQAG